MNTSSFPAGGSRLGKLAFVLIGLGVALLAWALPSSGAAPLPSDPGGTSTATATATPPACGPGWGAVPGGSNLSGLALHTSSDIWAVGLGGTILHYDGSYWRPAASPTTNALNAASALAADDAWAVGDALGGRPNTLHYDGAGWTAFPSPVYGLEGVAQAALTDTWAVGFNFGPNNTTVPNIIHWNGSAWTAVSGPHDGLTGNLTAVALAGADDVWAAGHYSTGPTEQPLFEHWTGAAWTQVASPVITGYASINALGVVSATDVWALGYNSTGAQTFTERWDGSAWSLVASPNIGDNGGLAVVASDDVWAVAGSGVMHWDGSAWKQVPAPFGGAAATASGAADVWAVGASGIEHYPDHPFFSDVPPPQPFYADVNWMACRHYISGYDCGGPGEPCDSLHLPYFRSGDPVRRAQIAKMTVNAAGWPLLNPPTPVFADVPLAHPYFRFVETATSHGIVSGYTCGGPGEPCDPQQRPYFRPYTDVTRAQVSKIIVLARGYPTPAPPSPTFADVPPSDPFYIYVEAAYAHGIIAGYNCGGPGEPCDPDHRPYFRPNLRASRGQVAKFITLAFGGP